eukprot:TRINITY_DN123769_c0_g1_i1.p1 TRINITY_DN123769_c0_g1~~TRINITY_DN123769_c0_g1_i1.p1  ORF type:complete len:209 (+),score=23.75 TRINITY_DN123769_c0_g1_i1:145-771(+)
MAHGATGRRRAGSMIPSPLQLLVVAAALVTVESLVLTQRIGQKQRPQCRPLALAAGDASNASSFGTIETRWNVSGHGDGVDGVEDTNHQGVFDAAKANNVLVTLYTTWCPNCQVFLREGGPLDEVVGKLKADGLTDKVTILKVDLEGSGVDRDALSMAGFSTAFVPGLFSQKKGIATLPNEYSGPTSAFSSQIYDWVLQSLDLTPKSG